MPFRCSQSPPTSGVDRRNATDRARSGESTFHRDVHVAYRARVSLDAVASARTALERGDVLIAYDFATTAVVDRPNDLEARYLAVLALARSGATRRAATEADLLSQVVERDATASLRLREDVAALAARLSKDRAFAAPVETRRALATDAARRYEQIADRYGGFYACINAATLRLLAGELDRCKTLATRALHLVSIASSQVPDDAYWLAATSAEASLLLRDLEGARTALARAMESSGANVVARAATRRQLKAICAVQGTDPALANQLRLPGVLHYCGHTLGRSEERPRRFPAELVDVVPSQVSTFLEAQDIGIAYGSLASGADIIIAESILEHHGELNVVLPFEAGEFEHVSVRPAGEDWVSRFRLCLDQAASFIQACDSAYMGDDELFSYVSHIAMGHARNRAGALGDDALQLAIWNGRPARGPGGTAEDIAAWRRAGGEAHIIALPSAPSTSAPKRPAERSSLQRSVQPILFADLRGFSRLHDEHYPKIIEALYAPLAKVVRRYEAATLYLNSWGDAIQMVFKDVTAAGLCALELQEVSESIDRSKVMLPEDLQLRIGLHVGPVFALFKTRFVTRYPGGDARSHVRHVSNPARRKVRCMRRMPSLLSPPWNPRLDSGLNTSVASPPRKTSRPSPCTGYGDPNDPCFV